jgi:hypothetical protein
MMTERYTVLGCVLKKDREKLINSVFEMGTDGNGLRQPTSYTLQS